MQFFYIIYIVVDKLKRFPTINPAGDTGKPAFYKSTAKYL